MTLTARAKPNLWTFVVLVPAFVGLAWAGVHAWATGFTDSQYRGKGAGLLNNLPPEALAAFFFFCAAACAFAIGILVKSRVSNQSMLDINDTGITSRALGGRGTLAWTEVSHLTSQDGWLYVHGKTPNGASRKLAVSLMHLDKPANEIMAAIRVHRPDLVR